MSWICESYHCTDTLSWDSKTYNTAVGGQDGRNMTAEDQLFRQFPPLNTSICEPCVIQDAREQALVYYLPDALTKDRQVRYGLLLTSSS